MQGDPEQRRDEHGIAGGIDPLLAAEVAQAVPRGEAPGHGQVMDRVGGGEPVGADLGTEDQRESEQPEPGLVPASGLGPLQFRRGVAHALLTL